MIYVTTLYLIINNLNDQVFNQLINGSFNYKSLRRNVFMRIRHNFALESDVGKGSCFTVTLPYSLLGKAKTRPLAPSDVVPPETHPLVEGVVLN